MKLGTRSLLFGAHQFLLHPVVVAIAWWKLYGFPKDPRLWVAFMVHDWGYWGMSAMDSEEGELHPYLGASIMGSIFDGNTTYERDDWWNWILNAIWGKNPQGLSWHDFTLLHSRFIAKQRCRIYSKLCVADKLAILCEPQWLYLPRVMATGELHEYMTHSTAREGTRYDGVKYEWDHLQTLPFWRRWRCYWIWSQGLRRYLSSWVLEHKDEKEDTWTPSPSLK